MCGKIVPTEEIIMTAHFKRKLNRYTVTDYFLCEKCKKEGFTLLFEVDKEKSNYNEKDNLVGIGDVYLTGRYVYVNNSSLKKDTPKEFGFITQELYNEIIERNGKSDS